NDASAWPAIIEQAVARLGRLDILVNNASHFDPHAAFPTESADASADSFQSLPEPRGSARATRQSPMTVFDSAEWDRMLRVNTVAPAALAHYARPHLSAHGSGRIINLCDISADRPWPGYLAYCASKAALLALTKSLARAYAPTITVNGVSPGIAVFPDEYPAALRGKLVARVPLAREGTPEEIARLARFLVESGDYITGQIISIDGGRSIV
ncbi:MAG: SDR family oxidoreductase, partial [Phycisphaerales bacterium]|nr:SDR family oxidoreductase [Phycisphaerales bacterium]